MIASACVAASLSPQAFGVDDVDVPLVAEEMLGLIQERTKKAKANELLDRLKARRR